MGVVVVVVVEVVAPPPAFFSAQLKSKGPLLLRGGWQSKPPLPPSLGVW